MTDSVHPYLDRPLRTEREAQRDVQRNCDHGADELCQRCDSGIGIDHAVLIPGNTYLISPFTNFVYPVGYYD